MAAEFCQHPECWRYLSDVDSTTTISDIRAKGWYWSARDGGLRCPAHPPARVDLNKYR